MGEAERVSFSVGYRQGLLPSTDITLDITRKGHMRTHAESVHLLGMEEHKASRRQQHALGDDKVLHAVTSLEGSNKRLDLSLHLGPALCNLSRGEKLPSRFHKSLDGVLHGAHLQHMQQRLGVGRHLDRLAE